MRAGDCCTSVVLFAILALGTVVLAAFWYNLADDLPTEERILSRIQKGTRQASNQALFLSFFDLKIINHYHRFEHV